MGSGSKTVRGDEGLAANYSVAGTGNRSEIAIGYFTKWGDGGVDLLPLPVIGLGISVWHILVERGIVADTQSCAISAPGGCATRWIEELGYSTIPTMAASTGAARRRSASATST